MPQNLGLIARSIGENGWRAGWNATGCATVALPFSPLPLNAGEAWLRFRYLPGIRICQRCI
jgi:hypothetical protein